MYLSCIPLVSHISVCVCHSVKLFEQHVNTSDPVWVAWVKHVEYLDLLFAPEISADDVLVLESQISEAQRAFDEVDEFKGCYKPKHHFASHTFIHILRLGPLRGYWCYSFEGLHQRVKRILRSSNFKSCASRIMKFWCHQFSHLMTINDPVDQRNMSNLC